MIKVGPVDVCELWLIFVVIDEILCLVLASAKEASGILPDHPRLRWSVSRTCCLRKARRSGEMVCGGCSADPKVRLYSQSWYASG